MSQRALTELLYGKAAHADPIGCVEDLSADLAAHPVVGFPHSIGQILWHMNYWMDYELRRIHGELPKYPEHAAESWPPSPTPANPQDWDHLRKRFAGLLAEYAGLAKSSPQEMQRQVEAERSRDLQVAGSLEAVLWQTVVHNSYHVGQIALLRRALGVWPPRAGGDTW